MMDTNDDKLSPEEERRREEERSREAGAGVAGSAGAADQSGRGQERRNETWIGLLGAAFLGAFLLIFFQGSLLQGAQSIFANSAVQPPRVFLLRVLQLYPLWEV